MFVVRTCIYMKVAVQFVSEAVLREHSANCFPDYGIRFTDEKILGCRETLASGIAGVTNIDLVCEFFTCETDFLGVDNDNIVTAVHVGGKIHLVLSAQNHCDL